MNKSEMTEVKSSAFSHVHHNPETGVLTIQFHSQKQHSFHPVTIAEYNEMMTSRSAGRYFSEHIRNNPAITQSQLNPPEEGELVA